MTDEKLVALLRNHLQRYPDLDIMDIYRLLHQAVFGPGKPVSHAKAAREWLERELALARPDSGQLLVESIHPEAVIVRLHLRPYNAVQGKLKPALDAFIDSSKQINGKLEDMAAYWSAFLTMIAEGGPLANRFDHRTAVLIGRTRAAENWPAMHHSPPFDQKYKPLYRVLTLAAAEKLLNKQHIPFEVK